MTRAFIHTGLAVALVLAPTLCCCQAGWFALAPQHARLATLLADQQVPVLPAHGESCCLKAKTTCCDSTSHGHTSNPSEKPAPAHAPGCACCTERPDAAPPEGAATESDPQPTGELLALARVGLLGYPEHADSVRANHPPDGAGADARYSALYERHVLRC